VPSVLLIFPKNKHPKGGYHAGCGRYDTRQATSVDSPFYPRQIWMITDYGNDEAVDQVENAAEHQEPKKDRVF
jgi:hypothetical protein